MACLPTNFWEKAHTFLDDQKELFEAQVELEAMILHKINETRRRHGEKEGWCDAWGRYTAKF